MSIKYEGNLNEKINELVSAEGRGELQVRKAIAENCEYFKVQAESYGGNGVHFNKTSTNRFSLSDHAKGVMYIADSPHTALNEFYQEDKFIDQSDFTNNCIAEIQIARPIVVFEETALAPHIGVPVGDLMGPKTVYNVTQQLAKELSKHADGLEYLSRHTGNKCVVLWSVQEDGNGMVTSKSVTPLKEYSHKGKTAKEILKSQLNIKVV
ncbi:RES family NAD+ phosphorylase (plasmid) [Providencia sp. R33]|uniref:RES family NAD+ phosphorylase n=1 Tax=Providencia sp. R33 TaxID=2828763 RepID=UPI001C5B1591|nr:RES family NAD+ phosphorylase [Providencia sp. R33]